MELHTLSASKLKTFASCPRKYYHQYIEKVPQPRHPSGAMGSSVHKAVERVYRNDTNDPLSAYNEAWGAEFTQYPELLSDQRTSKIQREGVTILGNYNFERRVPKEVELEFRLPFPDPIDPVCIIHGFIDQIYADATIVDLKTSRNRPLKGVLAFDPQFVLYDWAYLNLYGEVSSAVLWHHLRTSEDIVADVKGSKQFANVQRLVDRVLRLHRTVERRSTALQERGLVDNEVDTLFDRSVGESCLFCSYRVQCLGVGE
jgi:PD-(D/E)XK nuclease superfamily